MVVVVNIGSNQTRESQVEMELAMWHLKFGDVLWQFPIGVPTDLTATESETPIACLVAAD